MAVLWRIPYLPVAVALAGLYSTAVVWAQVALAAAAPVCVPPPAFAARPGIIKTPMHPEHSHATLATLHPVGRMGDVRDIVDAVLYLETAYFVTGEILHVDGGQNAGRW